MIRPKPVSDLNPKGLNILRSHVTSGSSKPRLDTCFGEKKSADPRWWRRTGDREEQPENNRFVEASPRHSTV
uniref:Uncharacterized protein n=1 Tax=Knipowitschia caucasica TaxID=637954 RepID=A0AAV2JCM5_KNICA